MRTSNKILLGTFIAILSIVTAIHAALYVKYKKNDFVTMTSLHYERFNTYNLKEVQSVSVSGLENVTVIPADTARVEIEKNGYINVRYEFANGVLTLKGDSAIAGNNKETERVKSSREVILYLPAVQHIKADFSNLTINGKKYSAAANSFVIDLNEASLHLGGWSRDSDTSLIHFTKIDVVKATASNIDVSGNVVMKELSLNLQTSNFEESSLTSDSLFINTDNSSSVKLSGKNIAKTKFALKP